MTGRGGWVHLIYGSWSLALALVLVLATGPASAAGPVAPGSDKGATVTATGLATPGIQGLATAKRRKDGALVVSGRLSGEGVLLGTGTRVITGKVAPGNSPGCVSDQGNVFFEGGGTLEIEIGGTAACTQFDRYSVALSLTLNAPTLNVLLINGFVPAGGQRFDVLNWGTLNGTFGTLNLPALPGGLQWDTSALYTSGELAVIDPNSGSVSDSDVPLPPWALLLLGAGLFSALRRQLRASN